MAVAMRNLRCLALISINFTSDQAQTCPSSPLMRNWEFFAHKHCTPLGPVDEAHAAKLGIIRVDPITGFIDVEFGTEGNSPASLGISDTSSSSPSSSLHGASRSLLKSLLIPDSM